MRAGAALGLLLVLAATFAGRAVEAAIRGKWINPSRSVIIEIAPCGHAYCGTVLWASEKAKRDAHRGTPHLVGSALLTDLKHSSGGLWKGKLFVPDQNMRVAAKLKAEGTTHLKVSGCAMMICKSQLWSHTSVAHG